MGFFSKAREIVWLLVKIDWFILSFICLMYFSNYLDRANLANAYVSGLKEDLGLKGNDYNKVQTSFTCGYVVGMLPQNLLLQYYPARVLFPLNAVIWGGLTMAAAKTTGHLCVIRFFQGLAESSTFVGAHVILGAWYTPAEIAKRAAIFSSSAQLATIFSGVLQARIYTTMDGLHGLRGYQWLFLICGMITVPIGIYGYLFFPDTPSTNRSIVFSAAERELAASRISPPPKTSLDRTIFRRVLLRWRWWLMCLIWIVGGELESIGSNGLMALFMKSRVAAGVETWTTQDFNYYPTGATAVSIVALMGMAIWTDWNGKRHQVNLLICAAMLVSSALILCQDKLDNGAIFFAFYLSGVSYAGQASNFSWANDICRNDEQERSIVLASMNMASNAVNAWWSILFFPADHAPTWKRGMISIIVLVPVMVVLTSVARCLQLRDERFAAASLEKGDAEPSSVDGVHSGKVSIDISPSAAVQELYARPSTRAGEEKEEESVNV
ncbi:hypothetical protein JCM10213v2_000512 [Rhodosporidiobolus nylandii]